MPTTLIQPLLAESSFDLQRDLGSTVDVAAEFSADREKNISITLRSSNVDFEIRGVIDAETRSMRGDYLKLTTNIQPEIFSGAGGRAARSSNAT